MNDPDAAAATIMRMHPEFDRDCIYTSCRTIDKVVWDAGGIEAVFSRLSRA